MRMKRLIAAAFLATFAASAPARAETVAGVLRCNVRAEIGFVIGFNHAVTCVYRRPGEPVEFYTGQTNTIGLDIGPLNARVVTYSVLGANPTLPARLEGEFDGPRFGLATNAGREGDVLIGGQGATTLLPIVDPATTSYTGTNLTIGVGRLQLHYAGSEPAPRHARGRRPDVELE
jgi:hypothetical protein